MAEERPPRNPATKAEDAALGGSSSNKMRRFSAGDSAEISLLLHEGLSGARRYAGGAWRGQDRAGLEVHSRVRRCRVTSKTALLFSLKWRSPEPRLKAPGPEKNHVRPQPLVSGCQQVRGQPACLPRAGTPEAPACPTCRQPSKRSRQRLEAGDSGKSCLLSLGWGGGLLSKAAADPQSEEFRAGPSEITPSIRELYKQDSPFPRPAAWSSSRVNLPAFQAGCYWKPISSRLVMDPVVPLKTSCPHNFTWYYREGRELQEGSVLFERRRFIV